MAINRGLITLPGAPALSDFRLARLRERLSAAGYSCAGLSARHVYIARFAGPPDASEQTVLVDLLDADQPPLAQVDAVVVPRLGTISPWSSRALDIARNCGLESLLRLERGVAWHLPGLPVDQPAVNSLIHDPMTQSIVAAVQDMQHLFATPAARPLRRVELGDDPQAALTQANSDWGLALSADEIAYLAKAYAKLGRAPSDAELVMFAQINSEHCRHKIFNADWVLDGQPMPDSLFDMIRASHAASPAGVLSAYKDNAAVVAGPTALRFFPGADRAYQGVEEPVHLLMKVETHNHPTAIAPDAGAATGAGGEIRDEAATGRGSRTKAGLCGFCVSNLHIPGFAHPWEENHGRPGRIASALEIMLEAPIGAARYNNEFGRPNLAGFFRSFEQDTPVGLRGYHKPIMIAGGMGHIRAPHVDKQVVGVDARLIVLGGPAMRIGLGGGAASSMASGRSSAELDLASVQRANPELERRCQEVIDGCWALGSDNPIASIHDVGAGGLSNALPEIIETDNRGGDIRLRAIVSADASLSPMEIWCNESQERYVLAVDADHLPVFEQLCARERCPYAVVGQARAQPQLTLGDDDGTNVIDLPMPVLFGNTPKMQRQAKTAAPTPTTPLPASIDPVEAGYRVLRLPCVADKSFLITIGDRSIGGQVAREQMVGPWQVPVADCAVTTTGFTGPSGEAMAMGERPPVALLDSAAAARMAVGEALTNLAAARVSQLADIRLSANWMAACGDAEEDARLFAAVQAVGAQLCPALGIAIPVGKDSLSMRTVWEAGGKQHDMRAPVSLIVSAFASVADATATLTPQLRTDCGATALVLVDLGAGKNRLGGSALTQVHGVLGETPPDVDDPALLRGFFATLQQLAADKRILAYHDRSDGGLFATLCEMMFAGRAGVEADISGLGEPAAVLFNEELGAVLQIKATDQQTVTQAFAQAGVPAQAIGYVSDTQQLCIRRGEQTVLRESRVDLHRAWSRTSYELRALRDDPDCARQEYDALLDDADPGLPAASALDPCAPYVNVARPRVAVLREQGVNGHVEMAWAFHNAGFEAVDIHMSELIAGDADLDNFSGLVACGGFSYGDVLGAGRGWAGTIRHQLRLRDMFSAFFADTGKFVLGVCNGCQMLTELAELIPGTDDWPHFVTNASEQFEARTVAVEIPSSTALFFDGMAGYRLPIAVAHGEGRAKFADARAVESVVDSERVALRYIDNHGRLASTYPANPNGSTQAITGVCNADGRVLAMMPHPERVIRSATLSWCPDHCTGDTPWARLFGNARRWID